jgi:hypothetical protein
MFSMPSSTLYAQISITGLQKSKNLPDSNSLQCTNERHYLADVVAMKLCHLSVFLKLWTHQTSLCAMQVHEAILAVKLRYRLCMIAAVAPSSTLHLLAAHSAVISALGASAGVSLQLVPFPTADRCAAFIQKVLPAAHPLFRPHTLIT